MAIDYFEPRLLTGVINLRPVRHALFASLFRPQTPKPVENFELQTSLRGAVSLPSITNHAPGTLLGGETLNVTTVKAPRFRPKRVFQAADMLKTQKGHTPYDPSVNPVERAIAEDMDAHRTDIDRMVEIMCAQAAVEGTIDLYDVLEGTAVKTYSVDFKRPASHNVVLSGDALWTSSASSLITCVENAGSLIQEDTGGLAPTDLILGRDCLIPFLRHQDVKDNLDNRRIEIGQIAPRVLAKFKGTWNGLSIWYDASTYVDMTGESRYYLNPRCALLLARDAESVIEYGLPVDIKCSGPTAIFAKSFEQEDPSGVFTIAESRPLPITRHVGWTVKIQALAA
jgi:hypothetical protein